MGTSDLLCKRAPQYRDLSFELSIGLAVVGSLEADTLKLAADSREVLSLQLPNSSPINEPDLE
jgi:hypothetical protein